MAHNWRIRPYRSDSSPERVRRNRLKRNVTETDEPEIGADSLKRYGNGLEQNRSDSDKSRQEPARLASKNEQSTPPGFDCEIFLNAAMPAIRRRPDGTSQCNTSPNPSFPRFSHSNSNAFTFTASHLPPQ